MRQLIRVTEVDRMGRPLEQDDQHVTVGLARDLIDAMGVGEERVLLAEHHERRDPDREQPLQ